MEKQTYTATLILNIRSDDSDGMLTGGSKYQLHYKKIAELPIPPAPGISILTWKPTRIKEVIIYNDGDIICFIEDQVLPVDRFEILMERYKKYLSPGGWEEDVQLRTWPIDINSGGKEWKKMSLEKRIDNLWENPKNIDLDSRFLYFISVCDHNGEEYSYVGKARNKGRLNEYRNNLKKIHAGEERGEKLGYRAVHFALYTALKNGWEIRCFPLENFIDVDVDADLEQLEKYRIAELNCNLNGARTWRVSQLSTLTLEDLLR